MQSRLICVCKDTVGDMAKIKIQEAEGAVLHYLVATLQGYTNLRMNPHAMMSSLIMNFMDTDEVHWFSEFRYTTQHQAKALEIIQGEEISIVTKAQTWFHTEYNALAIHGKDDRLMVGGDDYLTAALRCHVAYHMLPTLKHNFDAQLDIPDNILELLLRSE